eukprot:765988-Hanusia_phi.AAC.34
MSSSLPPSLPLLACLLACLLRSYISVLSTWLASERARAVGDVQCRYGLQGRGRRGCEAGGSEDVTRRS